MLCFTVILFCLSYLCFVEQSHGHGYLADPPARSSAWLYDDAFAACCRYYDHAEMFCGGTHRQWGVNGGKCSICGEAYDLHPRLLGRGDAMYLGKIVRTYVQGATIPVTVVLTANHMGKFEFRICNIDNQTKEDATQECLDVNQLYITSASNQFHVNHTLDTIRLNVTLPAHLTCKHCVFQWKYVTGNSWGTMNGKSCVGCGKENEEFYGCADVAVLSHTESIVDTRLAVTTTEAPPEKARRCVAAVTFSRSFDISSLMEQYCRAVCSTRCAKEKHDENQLVYTSCVATCDKLCSCD